MPAYCLLISQRDEDVEFAEKLSDEVGLILFQVNDKKELSQALIDHTQSVVLWDVDHPGARNSSDPLAVQPIGQTLGEFIAADRVFAISDSPLECASLPFWTKCIWAFLSQAIQQSHA